jgi:predicted RNase H-like HicB family nuclease
MSDQTATTTAPSVHVVTVEVMVRIKALAMQEADGRYSVVVPAIPGCVTQGDTIEEVEANVVEVSELMLDYQHDLSKDEAVRSMLP